MLPIPQKRSLKKETTSINRGYGLDFDTRVTTGEKEVSKIRADAFFRLKEGDSSPMPMERIRKLAENFDRIYRGAKSIFGYKSEEVPKEREVI